MDEWDFKIFIFPRNYGVLNHCFELKVKKISFHPVCLPFAKWGDFSVIETES